MSEERIALLLSWRQPGFSVHNTVRVAAADTAGIERLGLPLRLRLRVRPLAALFSGRLAQALGSVLRSPVAVERLELDPSRGEVLYHPKPQRERGKLPVERFEPAEFLARLLQHVPEPRLPRRTWAHLIRCVYEVDPLICQECGGEMRIVAFLLEPVAIRKILAYLEHLARLAPRGPPATGTGGVRAAS